MRELTSACVSMRQHTSAYVSIRQHTSAYVSIRHLVQVIVHLGLEHNDAQISEQPTHLGDLNTARARLVVRAERALELPSWRFS
jgi:hypothetical protein